MRKQIGLFTAYLWTAIMALAYAFPAVVIAQSKRELRGDQHEKPAAAVNGQTSQVEDNRSASSISQDTTSGEAGNRNSTLLFQAPRNTAAGGARLMAQAIALARARINASEKCRRFFGYQGIETINQTRYSFQELGPGGTAASVDGDTVFLNLNPKGAFMNPPANFAGLHNADEIRGFYILHELGHELSQATKFLVDHSVSKSMNTFRHDNNDELLRQNCYWFEVLDAASGVAASRF